MKKLLFVFTLISFLFSCGIIHIEKRHYRSGFYIQINNNSSQKETVSEDGKEETLSIIENIKPSEFNPEKIVAVEDKPGQKIAVQTGMGFPAVKKIEIALESEVKNKAEATDKTSGTKFMTTSRQESREGDGLFLLYFAPLLTIPFLFSLNQNRKLAEWFRNRKSTTRWIITGLHFLIAGTALTIGTVLNKCGFTIPKLSLDISLLFIFASMIFYPITLAIKNKGLAFKLRKGIIFIMIFSGSLGFASLTANDTLNHLDEWNFSTGMVDQYDDEKTPKMKSPVAAIFLTLLLTALLVTGGYLVVFASCELACSGYILLSFIVFYGGMFSLTLFYVFGLHQIFRPVPKTDEERIAYNKKSWKKSAIIAFVSSLIFFLYLISGME